MVKGSWLLFDFPRPLLAKRGSTSPCIPSPQAREKLRISRIPHSQSSGIAREACALKGERCVFYEMDINLPHVGDNKGYRLEVTG